MKRNLTIALLVTLLATTAAFGQGRGPAPTAPPGGGVNAGPGGPGPGPGPDLLAEYLGLTTEQKAAWQAAREESRTATQAIHEEKRAVMDELRTALEGTDGCAIGNLMLENKAIDGQLKAAHEALQAKLMAVLTAEQKAKFEAFQAAMAFLQQQGPGRGPGPGPGN